MSGEV
jgi:hypothetical protein